MKKGVEDRVAKGEADEESGRRHSVSTVRRVLCTFRWWPSSGVTGKTEDGRRVSGDGRRPPTETGRRSATICCSDSRPSTRCAKLLLRAADIGEGERADGKSACSAASQAPIVETLPLNGCLSSLSLLVNYSPPTTGQLGTALGTVALFGRRLHARVSIVLSIFQ